MAASIKGFALTRRCVFRLSRKVNSHKYQIMIYLNNFVERDYTLQSF